ncbi:g7763 [Coccomyxa elongata]
MKTANSSAKLAANLTFLACLLLVCGVAYGGSAGLQEGTNITNGLDICREPKHESLNRGAAVPDFNYASNGDDWPGLCQTGQQQSPIDLPEKQNSTPKAIPSNQLIKFGPVNATGNAVLRREIDEVEILSANWANDFSIPVCGGDNIGCLDGSSDSASVQYMNASIVNMHFHANSEHTRAGTYYGAEAHLVTAITLNGKQRLVVFGTWMDIEGNKTNAFFEVVRPYIDQSNGAACNAVPDNVTFNVTSFLPSNKTYYAYRGSLTTPPCTEGVTWIVFNNPVQMSVPQLKTLYKSNSYTSQPCSNTTQTTNQLCNILGARTNNRVLQPLNARTIELGTPATSGAAAT